MRDEWRRYYSYRQYSDRRQSREIDKRVTEERIESPNDGERCNRTNGEEEKAK